MYHINMDSLFVIIYCLYLSQAVAHQTPVYGLPYTLKWPLYVEDTKFSIVMKCDSTEDAVEMISGAIHDNKRMFVSDIVNLDTVFDKNHNSNFVYKINGAYMELTVKNFTTKEECCYMYVDAVNGHSEKCLKGSTPFYPPPMVNLIKHSDGTATVVCAAAAMPGIKLNFDNVTTPGFKYQRHFSNVNFTITGGAISTTGDYDVIRWLRCTAGETSVPVEQTSIKRTADYFEMLYPKETINNTHQTPAVDVSFPPRLNEPTDIIYKFRTVNFNTLHVFKYNSAYHKESEVLLFDAVRFGIYRIHKTKHTNGIQFSDPNQSVFKIIFKNFEHEHVGCYEVRLTAPPRHLIKLKYCLDHHDTRMAPIVFVTHQNPQHCVAHCMAAADRLPSITFTDIRSQILETLSYHISSGSPVNPGYHILSGMIEGPCRVVYYAKCVLKYNRDHKTRLINIPNRYYPYYNEFRLYGNVDTRNSLDEL